MNTEAYEYAFECAASQLNTLESTAARAAAKQPRQACKPTTPEDLHRLAKQAVDHGVSILKAPGISAYFALSASTPGLIYPVDPVGGCVCMGYQRVQRCQHHSYLLAILNRLPALDTDPDPDPAPQSPALAPTLPAVPVEAAPFVRELIALRRPWDDLARSITYAKHAGAYTPHQLSKLLAEARAMRKTFDRICNDAAAYGVSRETLREVWRGTVPAPAPTPGAAASEVEAIALAELERQMLTASRDVEVYTQLYEDACFDADIAATNARKAKPEDKEQLTEEAERAAEYVAHCHWRFAQAYDAYRRAARHYTIAANGDDYNAAIAA